MDILGMVHILWILDLSYEKDSEIKQIRFKIGPEKNVNVSMCLVRVGEKELF